MTNGASAPSRTSPASCTYAHSQTHWRSTTPRCSTSTKRVVTWHRGVPASADQVVVVANFSDWGTRDPTAPDAEYLVHNWPATPPGRRWHEITQDRDVPHEWAGREPLYPWEANVYELVSA